MTNHSWSQSAWHQDSDDGPYSLELAVQRCAVSGSSVSDVGSFKNWIRTDVRTVLPHGLFACVHGRIYGVGVSPDCVLTVDFPLDHLQAIRNASGHMDTPLASRWFELQQPVFFDGCQTLCSFPDSWLRNFHEHDLRNAAADGFLDKVSCIATYFSFHQLPEFNEPVLRKTFSLLTPILHATFARVIRAHGDADVVQLDRYGLLSTRECEIASYVAEGMSNGEIAKVLAVSENTIRNHISRIFDKTGCGNRTALACLVVQHTARSRSMGTKVL